MVIKIGEEYRVKSNGDVVEIIYCERPINLLQPKEQWKYRGIIRTTKTPGNAGTLDLYMEKELEEINTQRRSF